MWQEIPIWQGIDFTDGEIMHKAYTMMNEMMHRDKNRAGIAIWSIANETWPSAPQRTEVLIDLAIKVKHVDDTRLLSAAFDNISYNHSDNTFRLIDPLTDYLDIISVNKYMGWYDPFPIDPAQIRWDICLNKPLFISEFGGEALHGRHGDKDTAWSWSEEFQEELYRKNLIMFDNIPNLKGICPWILFDFRSPTRLHPINQDGWNRKGLLSDRAERKKAWFVIKEYYKNR